MKSDWGRFQASFLDELLGEADGGRRKDPMPQRSLVLFVCFFVLGGARILVSLKLMFSPQGGS